MEEYLDFAVENIVDYHSIIGGPVSSSGHKITNIEIVIMIPEIVIFN